MAEEKQVRMKYPFLAIVQVTFIVLKCAEVTAIGAWPWWKVLLPIELALGTMAALFVVAGLLFVAAHLIDKREQRKKQAAREALKVASFRSRES